MYEIYENAPKFFNLNNIEVFLQKFKILHTTLYLVQISIKNLGKNSY